MVWRSPECHAVLSDFSDKHIFKHWGRSNDSAYLRKLHNWESSSSVTEWLMDKMHRNVHGTSFFSLCPLIPPSPGQTWQLILNCLEDNSKGQHKQTVEKMYLPLLSPWKEDNNTCWRGLIVLKCWEAQATSTIAALVFHLFLYSSISWPPTFSFSTLCTPGCPQRCG